MKQQRMFYRFAGGLALVLCLAGAATAVIASASWGVALLGLGLAGVLVLQHLNHLAASRHMSGVDTRCDEIMKALARIESRQGDVVHGSISTRLAELHKAGARARSDMEALGTMTTDLVRRVKIYHKATAADIGSIRSDLRTRTERLPGEVVELWRASSLLIPELADLPLPGGWAVTVSTLTTIINEVSRNPERETVVECGSGVSTIWLGFALRRRGHGHVYALEHDPKYAEATRAYVRSNRLDQWVTVVDAPLVDYTLGGASYQWYSLEGISDVTSIDLLFVDGPPASTGPRARYPAFPALAEKLGAGAWLILDDTVRQEERDIADAWLSETHSGVRLRQLSELPKSVVLSAASNA